MNDNAICAELITTEIGGFFMRLQKENLILQMIKNCRIKNLFLIWMINFWLNGNFFVHNLLPGIKFYYRFGVLIFK